MQRSHKHALPLALGTHSSAAAGCDRKLERQALDPGACAARHGMIAAGYAILAAETHASGDREPRAAGSREEGGWPEGVG